ncbi:glycine-rich domain-containing protein [Amycolatopsis sp. NPDC059027]|uniref:glycine-rich domain-containing protein n=1 Tax=Amycolatopsis sp. NPDC059027 TaxID=3346709 RepID=UPI003670C77F
MTISVEQLTGQGLVSETLFGRLVGRVAQEEACTTVMARRIVDQALAYLATCAKVTESLAPSATVDIGWHTFILHTREYAEFCDRIAGRFIHHVPHDEDDDSSGTPLRDVMRRTVTAISAAGFAVDHELWFTPSAQCADCSQCKNGCSDDPPPPPASN